MKVRFWGTRGSLPAPVTAADIRAKMVRAFEHAVGQNLKTSDQIEAFVDTELDFATAGTYGGNTSCIEIDDGSDEYILCDLGSGARAFGNNFMAAPHPGKKKVFNIFISHIHWDHIMGFPLFTPAYIPGHKIIIHGCHQLLEQAFRTQHSSPGFPIPFDALGADIEFAALQPGETYEVGNLTVRPMLQYHEGDSFGYRFEGNGKSIVYSTDSEHRQDLTEESDAAWAAFVAFFKNADVVIFDAMYSMADAVSVKQDWGHSSNIVGVELCHEAGVKHSIPELLKVAAGHAVLTIVPEPDGVVRRVPLAVSIGGQIVPALAVEMARVGLGVRSYATIRDESGLRALRIGDAPLATQSDGRVWVHYTRHQPERYVSVVEVLEGRLATNRLAGHLVLVGTSAIGLGEPGRHVRHIDCGRARYSKRPARFV